MHPPGAQVPKSMHTAAKMCTQGAGCTLNFEHCRHIIHQIKADDLSFCVYFLSNRPTKEIEHIK